MFLDPVDRQNEISQQEEPNGKEDTVTYSSNYVGEESHRQDINEIERSVTKLDAEQEIFQA